jgi:hypothetical protein
MYDEEEVKEAVKCTIMSTPLYEEDRDLKKFEEWWSYKGFKSVKQGVQGGRQRMKSKLSAQLESLASKLVTLKLLTLSFTSKLILIFFSVYGLRKGERNFNREAERHKEERG